MPVVRHRVAVALVCISLVGGGVFLAHSSSDDPPPPRPTRRWVRTLSGWHEADWVHRHAPHAPTLHPGLVAAFIGLSSTTALLAFGRQRK